MPDCSYPVGVDEPRYLKLAFPATPSKSYPRKVTRPTSTRPSMLAAGARSVELCLEHPL